MSDDLISRSALLRYMNRRLADIQDVYTSYDAYAQGYEEAVCRVEDAPTVDAVPVVHGRWIHTKIEDSDWGGTFNSWECSVCGYCAGRNPTGTNYCPNCGAMMDGDGKI